MRSADLSRPVAAMPSSNLNLHSWSFRLIGYFALCRGVLDKREQVSTWSPVRPSGMESLRLFRAWLRHADLASQLFKTTLTHRIVPKTLPDENTTKELALRLPDSIALDSDCPNPICTNARSAAKMPDQINSHSFGFLRSESKPLLFSCKVSRHVQSCHSASRIHNCCLRRNRALLRKKGRHAKDRKEVPTLILPGASRHTTKLVIGTRRVYGDGSL